MLERPTRLRCPWQFARVSAAVSFLVRHSSDISAVTSISISREQTGKPVADITRYTYRDRDTRYVVTFERQKTILQAVFTERMPLIKRLLAKIVGFDGAYHRFTGKVTIEKFEKDVRAEIFDDQAIWELMYFGKSRSPTL